MVEQVFARIETFFRDCIAAGQIDGTIRSTQPAADLARLLLSAMLGLRVLSHAPGLNLPCWTAWCARSSRLSDPGRSRGRSDLAAAKD